LYSDLGLSYALQYRYFINSQKIEKLCHTLEKLLTRPNRQEWIRVITTGHAIIEKGGEKEIIFRRPSEYDPDSGEEVVKAVQERSQNVKSFGILPLYLS